MARSWHKSVQSFDSSSDLTLVDGDLEAYNECAIGKDINQLKEQLRPRSTHTSLIYSASLAAGILMRFRGLLWVLVPSFIRSTRAHDTAPQKLHSTAYLDGMRGLAAFAVFLCHLSYGTWDTSHVYGAAGGNNIHLFRLPIIRLLYAGPPMVAIFFVISGFALSHKPIKLMRAQRREDILMTITSAVFRRAIRLFLPCFVSTLLIAILCQLGFYERTAVFAQNMRATSEDHPWTEPNLILQLTDWAHQILQFVNVFDWSLYAGSIALDRHLWTIPAEYRCSMALFLTLVMTARMSTKARLLTVGCLIYWAMHWDRWELVPFWAGAMLAEIDLGQDPTSAPYSECTLSPSTRCCRQQWANLFYVISFVCGLYLASFPDADGHATPGYIWLNSRIPAYWTEKHRFWPTVAAIQIVWSVSKVQCLKNVFTTRIVQYIGQISFPLYLMHGPVIHTFGYTVMNTVYACTGTDDLTWLKIGFAAAASATTIIIIWVSDIFWRVIDKPSVKFAKWLEAKLFVF